MKAFGIALTGLAVAIGSSVALAAPAAGPPKDDAAVQRALDEEMARATKELRLGTEGPPYYVGYTLTDVDRSHVGARLGAVVSDDHHPTRTVRVEVRVGSPDEDNTNFRDAGGFGARGYAAVSREDDVTGLRRDLWELTDHEYKHALESLARKKAGKSVDLVVLNHEDHWLSHSDTRLQMLQATMDFLLKNNPPT